MKSCFKALIIVIVVLATPSAWAINLNPVSTLDCGGAITSINSGGSGVFHITTSITKDTGDPVGEYIEVTYAQNTLRIRQAYVDPWPLLASAFQYDAQWEKDTFHYLIRSVVPESPQDWKAACVIVSQSPWRERSEFFYSSSPNAYNILNLGSDRLAIFDEPTTGSSRLVRYDISDHTDPGWDETPPIKISGKNKRAESQANGNMFLANGFGGFQVFKYMNTDSPLEWITINLQKDYPTRPVEIVDFIVEGNDITLLFYDPAREKSGILKMEYDLSSEYQPAMNSMVYGLWDSDLNMVSIQGNVLSMTKIGSKILVAKGEGGIDLIEERKVTNLPIPAEKIMPVSDDKQKFLVTHGNTLSVYSLGMDPVTWQVIQLLLLSD